MTRSVALLAAVVAAACGNDDLDATEAREVFTLGNDLVHELHTDALALPAWPATYELACPEGGRIAMTSVLVNGSPDQLLHAFMGCGVGGWVLDGRLDYVDITFCAPTTPSFAMFGRFEIAGRGDCAIDARETCGVISGTSCGATL